MAEVKTAPPLAAASENPPNEANQNSGKSKASGGGSGGGSGNNSGRRRGDRGGGSGHGGNGSGYDNDHDNGSVGRRKKPELEHYKPGAFGSRKPEDEASDTHVDETPQHSGNNKHSKVSLRVVSITYL